MNCAVCDNEIMAAYWHQKRPVERDLCLGCAETDMRANPFWHGETMVLGGDGVKYKADYSAPDPKD